MKRRSLYPDSFSFAFLLKAAANSGSLYAGTQLHSHVTHCNREKRKPRGSIQAYTGARIQRKRNSQVSNPGLDLQPTAGGQLAVKPVSEPASEVQPEPEVAVLASEASEQAVQIELVPTTVPELQEMDSESQIEKSTVWDDSPGLELRYSPGTGCHGRRNGKSCFKNFAKSALLTYLVNQDKEPDDAPSEIIYESPELDPNFRMARFLELVGAAQIRKAKEEGKDTAGLTTMSKFRKKELEKFQVRPEMFDPPKYMEKHPEAVVPRTTKLKIIGEQDLKLSKKEALDPTRKITFQVFTWTFFEPGGALILLELSSSVHVIVLL
ncbi:hypothetical protein KSP39_PZI019177 [Platanthera zijinensis]|uniref:Uncharacterized protein n=1 Tax=Platanthera zijinensis TaxID=2320716 RepID=A0AAP0FYJ4_9ASPA